MCADQMQGLLCFLGNPFAFFVVSSKKSEHAWVWGQFCQVLEGVTGLKGHEAKVLNVTNPCQPDEEHLEAEFSAWKNQKVLAKWREGKVVWM